MLARRWTPQTPWRTRPVAVPRMKQEAPTIPIHIWYSAEIAVTASAFWLLVVGLNTGVAVMKMVPDKSLISLMGIEIFGLTI